MILPSSITGLPWVFHQCQVRQLPKEGAFPVQQPHSLPYDHQVRLINNKINTNKTIKLEMINWCFSFTLLHRVILNMKIFYSRRRAFLGSPASPTTLTGAITSRIVLYQEREPETWWLFFCVTCLKNIII